MKRAVLGILVSVGLVMAAVAVAQQRGELLGQRPTLAAAAPAPAVAAGSELIVVPAPLGDTGRQMLTVVDPRQRVMAVYHIDLATGKIALKSVRNIQWDLQIEDLNNDGLTPKEIRSGLEHLR
jgi:hypothetical protein